MKRELSKNIKLPCWTSRLSSSSCIEVNNMLPENNWWPSQMIRRHHVHSFGKFSFQNSFHQFTVKIRHPQLPKKSLSSRIFFTSLGLLLGGLGNTELHCLTQRGDDLSESSTVKSWIFFDILLFIFKFLNNSINFLQFRPVIWAV